jgi:signal transduction histidine kinase
MSQLAGERQPPAYPAYPGPSDSRPARPPLTKRMRAGHWIVIDSAVGVVAAFCASVAGRSTPGGQDRFPVVLFLMAAVFLPVALRRRAPATAFGALVILGVLVTGLYPAVPLALSPAIFLAAAYVLYTVTVEGRRRSGAAALGLVLAVMIALFVVARHGGHPGSDGGAYVPVALACVIAWTTGYSVRQRRRYLVTLQQRAASSAVAEERLRIARELHDVVAHSMSVIAVQAGYGQYVIDTSPTGAREALGAIQATSRDALEEMRRMLGVLRQQDPGPASVDATGPAGPGSVAPPPGQPATAGQLTAGPSPASRAPLAPAPGLARLGRLVTRTGGAGVRVTLETCGPPRPAPASVDLSAYRIIQEALTNVVRHAGTGAVCLVTVRYTDADLVIRVTDDGGPSAGAGSAGPTARAGIAALGAGHGIIGMRERVNLCGGSFSAGPRPGGGFEVEAALPLPAAALAADTRAAGAAAPLPDETVAAGTTPAGRVALGHGGQR